MTRRRLSLPMFEVTEVDYSGGVTQPGHHHERSVASLVIKGTLSETVGTRTEAARAASLVVKPAGTDHADAYDPPGVRILSITFDRRLLGLLPEGGRSLHWWRWWHGPGPLARAMLR